MKLEPPIKTKKFKNKIVLKNGEELRYHVPPKPEFSLKLKDYIPENNPLVEVEIGAGSGRFIALRSQLFKDRFFIGIDRRKDRFDSTLKKLSRNDDQNWVLLKEDARSFVSEEMPDIQVLHVYHPDPWPKDRHHKHRFFRSPDAKVWAQAIVSGGEFRISTDHKGYFEEILSIVDSWNMFDLDVCYQKRDGQAWSRFEEIFLSRYEPVYKAYFVKK